MGSGWMETKESNRFEKKTRVWILVDLEVTLHQLLPFINSEEVELNSSQMRDLIESYFKPQKRNSDSIRRVNRN